MSLKDPAQVKEWTGNADLGERGPTTMQSVCQKRELFAPNCHRFQGRRNGWKERRRDCKIAERGIGRSCNMGVLVLVDHQSNHLYSSDVLLYQKEYSKEYVIYVALRECNLLLLFGCITNRSAVQKQTATKATKHV